MSCKFHTDPKRKVPKRCAGCAAELKEKEKKEPIVQGEQDG